MWFVLLAIFMQKSIIEGCRVRNIFFCILSCGYNADANTKMTPIGQTKSGQFARTTLQKWSLLGESICWCLRCGYLLVYIVLQTSIFEGRSSQIFFVWIQLRVQHQKDAPWKGKDGHFARTILQESILLGEGWS